MSRELAVSRYEKLLLGKDTHFYLSGSEQDKEQDALMLFRYIIRDLLEWTPAAAMNDLNWEIMEKLHIDKLTRYIILPVGMTAQKDCDYVVHMAFPKETRYSAEKKIIQNYEALMKGSMSKFPKNYFNKNSGGMYRAKTLLAFAISSFLPLRTDDPGTLFKIFADLTEANKLLKDWKLLAPCKTLYNKSPLKYLYDTVEHTPGTEFLYNNYKFVGVYDKMSKDVPISFSTRFE